METTILQRQQLQIGDRVTNGRGNGFRVIGSTEDRFAEIANRYLGPSVQVQNQYTFWIDERCWNAGEWYRI